MPVLALRLTALAALAISVSGCVMEAYGSRARSDAQSWIGLPIQDVIKRFGEPERVTGGNRSINPVLADGFFQEAEAEAGEQFHGSSAS
ncbi:hypothetical protein I5J19_20845 [Pseudomonas aeruginosa]|nr:hypothetical protein [Pseudomonas aeruginosa]MBG7270428.1 hypothetical protein [Pseudomonas aeruginosa]